MTFEFEPISNNSPGNVARVRPVPGEAAAGTARESRKRAPLKDDVLRRSPRRMLPRAGADPCPVRPDINWIEQIESCRDYTPNGRRGARLASRHAQPAAREVVGQAQGDQDKQPEQAGGDHERRE